MKDPTNINNTEGKTHNDEGRLYLYSSTYGKGIRVYKGAISTFKKLMNGGELQE